MRILFHLWKEITEESNNNLLFSNTQPHLDGNELIQRISAHVDFVSKQSEISNLKVVNLQTF